MNIKIALKLNEFEGYFYVCWTWIQLERNQSRVFTPSVVNHKPLTVMSWVDEAPVFKDTYKSQDNLTNLLQLSVLNFFRIKFIFDSIRWTINIK